MTVVRRPLSQVLRTIRFDPALEPYYLLAKAWSIPSTSEFWLRMLSVLAMATAVTVLWALTVRLVGQPAGRVRGAGDAGDALDVPVRSGRPTVRPDRAAGRPWWLPAGTTTGC